MERNNNSEGKSVETIYTSVKRVSSECSLCKCTITKLYSEEAYLDAVTKGLFSSSENSQYCGTCEDGWTDAYTTTKEPYTFTLPKERDDDGHLEDYLYISVDSLTNESDIRLYNTMVKAEEDWKTISRENRAIYADSRYLEPTGSCKPLIGERKNKNKKRFDLPVTVIYLRNGAIPPESTKSMINLLCEKVHDAIYNNQIRAVIWAEPDSFFRLPRWFRISMEVCLMLEYGNNNASDIDTIALRDSLTGEVDYFRKMS